MSNLVILRRCATVEEAIVIDSALKAGGFQSNLGEYFFAHIHPAFGGVSVFVPEVQFAEAQSHLAELRASAAERLTDELGPVDMAPLKLRKVRAWILMALFCTPLDELIIMAFTLILAFLMSLLPIDWAALAAANTSYLNPLSDFGPIVTTGDSSPIRSAVLKPEGLVFLLVIALFIAWDMLVVTEHAKMAEHSQDNKKNIQT